MILGKVTGPLETRWKQHSLWPNLCGGGLEVLSPLVWQETIFPGDDTPRESTDDNWLPFGDMSLGRWRTFTESLSLCLLVFKWLPFKIIRIPKWQILGWFIPWMGFSTNATELNSKWEYSTAQKAKHNRIVRDQEMGRSSLTVTQTFYFLPGCLPVLTATRGRHLDVSAYIQQTVRGLRGTCLDQSKFYVLSSWFTLSFILGSQDSDYVLVDARMDFCATIKSFLRSVYWDEVP